jgi:ribosomal protein S18 acetylase RimI-like enzyme
VSGTPTHHDIAGAADANFVVHATWVARHTPGMTVLEDTALVLVDSGLPCDTFNFVCRSRLGHDDVGPRASATIARFASVGRPFSWWVGPADTPNELGERLVAAGLKESERELAMAADLDAVPELPPPADFVIRRVQTPQELVTFAALSAANWTPPDQDVFRFYARATAVLLRDDAPQWLYLGYANGDAVATAVLTEGGTVVGLYNISTRADARGRGYGSAMTRQLLVDARERGFRTAVLQAAPDGVRIYERLGFTPFGPITEYKP